MSKDKQIEENNSCCNSCMHRQVCWQYDNSTLACSHHKDEREYRKTSDVAVETLREVEKIIRKHSKVPQYDLMFDIYKLKQKHESEGKK